MSSILLDLCCQRQLGRVHERRDGGVLSTPQRCCSHATSCLFCTNSHHILQLQA